MTDDNDDNGAAPQRYLWEYSIEDRRRGPAAFSAVRRGAGRTPGSVPEMWEYHLHLDGDERDKSTNAEHHALVLFGFHQQSQSIKVHRKGSRLGAAVFELRERFSAEAVDTRFFRAVTAVDLDELGNHLRGLVTQLRSLPVTPTIDYTQLVVDLARWQDPAQVDRIRRKWGAEYHRARGESSDAAALGADDVAEAAERSADVSGAA